MPELPEVETVKRGLAPALCGKMIVEAQIKRDDLRFPFPQNFAQKLTGRTVLRLERRAKYILAFLDDETIWLSHLGMTGRFSVFAKGGAGQNLAEFYFQTGSEDAGQGKHDHVVLTLDDGTIIVYTDPRRFGIMDHFSENQIQTHKLLANIGVEPLGNELNAEYLVQHLIGKKAPLKSFLLDQKYIAGLGNIYVCEALFRSRLSPMKKSSTLVKNDKPTSAVEDMVTAVRAVLNEAIEAGGSTLSDYAGTDGKKGAFQQKFDVYGREGKSCTRIGCNGEIERIVQSGRSTFYCPECQK